MAQTGSIESLAERLARRTEAFECFTIHRRQSSVGFEAGRLKSAQGLHRDGFGLRVAVGGRLAVGGTADPDAVDRTIDSTIEAAAFADPWQFRFAGPAKAALDAAAVFDPAVARLTPDDLVATGRWIVDQLADVASAASLNVHLEAGQERHRFVNSAGQRFDCERTDYGISIEAEFFGEDDIFFVAEHQAGCGAKLDLDWMIGQVRHKFQQARRVVPVGPAEQTLVFSPHGLEGLLAPLLAGLNGQNVADGVSPLADKRGGPALLDDKLTLIDDGTLAGRTGSQPFDDEGLATQRTVLIGGGRVEDFLLDLRSAAKLGLASTAKAARSLTGPPHPAPSNLILQPGDQPLERLIGQVREGLLIEFLLGVGQGNVAAGDYANPIGLGYKIRDGQVVGRVKNCSIAGNVYADLKQVTAIEDRGYWHGASCLPHVRIDGLSVAAG